MSVGPFAMAARVPHGGRVIAMGGGPDSGNSGQARV